MLPRVRFSTAMAVVAISTLTACSAGSKSTPSQGAPSSSVSPSSAPQRDVTKSGARLRDLEGLLDQKFPSRTVDVRWHDKRGLVFTHKFVSMASTPAYVFTFRRPTSAGTLRLSTRKPVPEAPSLSRAEPILIGNRYIMCDNSRYLVRDLTALSFTLDCVPAR
jgi:hypothetical protein